MFWFEISFNFVLKFLDVVVVGGGVGFVCFLNKNTFSVLNLNYSVLIHNFCSGA